MSWKILRASALAASIFLSATSANAELITLEMHFSGAGQGNTVRADGTLTIDVPIYAETGFEVSTTDIRNFSMVVSGSKASDGVFNVSIQKLWYGDYPGVVNFYSPSKLDFTKELVGQRLSNGDHFFTPGEYDESDQTIHNGGFWLWGPLNGFSMYYQLPGFSPSGTVDTWELIRLESLHAAGYIPSAPVPEPSTYAMMLAGMALIVTFARGRKKA